MNVNNSKMKGYTNFSIQCWCCCSQIIELCCIVLAIASWFLRKIAVLFTVHSNRCHPLQRYNGQQSYLESVEKTVKLAPTKHYSTILVDSAAFQIGKSRLLKSRSAHATSVVYITWPLTAFQLSKKFALKFLFNAKFFKCQTSESG